MCQIVMSLYRDTLKHFTLFKIYEKLLVGIEINAIKNTAESDCQLVILCLICVSVWFYLFFINV